MDPLATSWSGEPIKQRVESFRRKQSGSQREFEPWFDEGVLRGPLEGLLNARRRKWQVDGW
jgi:hypothetical protein